MYAFTFAFSLNLSLYEHKKRPSFYCIKTVSHAINSHVLTVLTLQIRILGCHKNDVINSNVNRNERNLVGLG